MVGGNTSIKRAEIRNTLLSNGYLPLPAAEKGVIIKGWTTCEIDQEWLAQFERNGKFSNTGLRCDNLVAFDIDVLDADLAATIEATIEAKCGPTNYCRVGRAPKSLLLYRLDEGELRSHRSGKYGDHQVELLAGRGRQFIAYGIHPGTGKAYTWEAENPLDNPIDQLPGIDAETALAALTLAEADFIAAGLTETRPGSERQGEGERLDDLTPDFEVETSGGVMTWDEFKTWLTPEGAFVNIRREDGEFGDSWGVHAVIHPGTGSPMLFDFTRDTTHVEPVNLATLSDDLVPQTNMFDNDSIADLIENYVLIRDGTVRDINEPEKFWDFNKFKLAHSNWRVPNPDPGKGKPQVVEAVVAWRQDPRRMTATEALLRPDHPDKALITEGRNITFNTYLPPDHPVTGGEIETWLEFMEHLIPDAVERDLFLDWLALKVVHPGWRMHAIVMVTRAFGTGRGTLNQILQLLLGVQYVNELTLHDLISKTGQAQYNDIQADSLMITVPEALEETDEQQSRFYTRQHAYEQLKMVCDPISQRVHVRRKTRPNTIQQMYASILISSNHVDALAIPDGDRRLVVLSNGDVMLVDAPGDLNNRIHAWKHDARNIGALYRDLVARAPGIEYDPFGEPPMTRAKRDMIAASKSETDMIWQEFIIDAPGDLATHYQWRDFAHRFVVSNKIPYVGDQLDRAINQVWKQRSRDILELPSGQLKVAGKSIRPRAIRNFDAWLGVSAKNSIKSELEKNGNLGGDLQKLPNR